MLAFGRKKTYIVGCRFRKRGRATDDESGNAGLGTSTMIP
jgi:hypothetical protein